MSGHFFWQVRSWGPARSIRPGEDARHSISQLVARLVSSSIACLSRPAQPCLVVERVTPAWWRSGGRRRPLISRSLH